MQNSVSEVKPVTSPSVNANVTPTKNIKPVFSPPSKKLLVITLLIFGVLVVLAVLLTRSLNSQVL